MAPEQDINFFLHGAELSKRFDRWTTEWHKQPIHLASMKGDIHGTIEWLHYNNYSLWHFEDEVRRSDVPDAIVVQCKRQIDTHNQQRNDGIEAIDVWIDEFLKESAGENADGLEMNSETAGSIIDRLSILSLKIYHMQEQMLRKNISVDHQLKAKERLEILVEQRRDLVAALDRLWDDFIHHRKVHKLYRQFKMYNDPDTNPALYNPHPKESS